MVTNSSIRVITIDREFACGGSEIAASLARRLGWELWDHALSFAIAKRVDRALEKVAEHEERRDPAFYQLLKGFISGSFEGSIGIPHIDLLDADRVMAIACELVHDAAHRGNAVIVGRGSAYCLEDHPEAFHVFIHAPMEDKIHRLVAEGMAPKAAREHVKTVDKDRSAFIRRYFHKEWPKHSLYDLMINSALGTETVVDLILTAVTSSAPKRAKAAPSKVVKGPDLQEAASSQ